MLIKLNLFVIYNLIITTHCLQMLMPNTISKFRSRRSLGFTDGVNFVQYIFGIGFPIELQQQSITIGSVVKCSYQLPNNNSFFTQHLDVVSLRKKQSSSLTRWDIYNILSTTAERLGLGGKECILQTICQIAEIPFDLNHSIFEELLHTIFTPSSTSEILLSNSDSEYLAAEKLGNSGVECKKVFPKCDINFSDLFSKVIS